MNGTKTWIIALIALVLGAVIAYVYMQGQIGDLNEQVATLEEQLADANDALQNAAAGSAALEGQLQEKDQVIAEQQARIAELEAAPPRPTAPEPQPQPEPAEPGQQP